MKEYTFKNLQNWSSILWLSQTVRSDASRFRQPYSIWTPNPFLQKQVRWVCRLLLYQLVRETPINQSIVACFVIHFLVFFHCFFPDVLNLEIFPEALRVSNLFFFVSSVSSIFLFVVPDWPFLKLLLSSLVLNLPALCFSWLESFTLGDLEL